jgi:hypothetical protein
MKYKYKKNDIVYMVFAGELIKGIITKRYKSNDAENLYHVDFRSLNAGLGITADFVHIGEYRLNKSYQILLDKMLDNLIDRLKLEDKNYESKILRHSK